MLILTKDQVEYCEVAALVNGQQKKLSGFIYRNNVFVKVKHYGADEYDNAIKDCRENFLDNEERQIPTLVIKESDTVSIWIQDNRYKPVPGSAISYKTPANPTVEESGSNLRLRDLVARMRGKDGFKIKTRRHKLKLYKRCFLGNEAVDWIVANMRVDRSKAIKICQKLVDKKVIHHVSDEYTFKDEPLFYRFYRDEEKSIWTDEL